MKGKRIIMAVTNDLVVDQRVHRTASTLVRNGADVLVVGRKLPDSQEISERPYRIKRLRLPFLRGPLFYACYNFRLFCILLLRKADLLVSNDLDTLLACFLVSRLKACPLIYDSHEYFTEVPELVGRNFTRRIWQGLEKWILPRIKYASTVSPSVADAYYERYRIRMEVIRNLPYLEGEENRRPDLQGSASGRIIIYQGVLNRGRGLEAMISAMQYLDDFQFQIFGWGDITVQLEELVKSLKVEDRVMFMGRLPFQELKEYTRRASLGISLEEDLGLNYRFALPNKLFDYIQAGIPVLVSNFPEMRRVVEEFDIGQVLKDPDPESLADQVREMMNSDEQRITWNNNLRKAAGELCWEKEEGKLLALFGEAVKD
jgi:glycosyltransferase involved in cell wall biosynthesis